MISKATSLLVVCIATSLFSVHLPNSTVGSKWTLSDCPHRPLPGTSELRLSFHLVLHSSLFECFFRLNGRHPTLACIFELCRLPSYVTLRGSLTAALRPFHPLPHKIPYLSSFTYMCYDKLHMGYSLSPNCRGVAELIR